MKKLIFLLLLIASVTIFAAKYRRPFANNIGVNYGFDNNYGSSGCKDFACGSVCYDGHGGTDFPLVVGTDILAPANGKVIATYNGCANYGGLGNTCGGRCGNYVKIDYGGGYTTLFCHLKLDSIVVSTGQQVSCGQKVGQSASSGNSSGPHLHFGTYVNGTSEDPFSGSCGGPTSYWVNQGSYPHNIPSATCESTCACTPGQVQTQGCGNCGVQSRTCGSNCQWGSWGGCTNQGVCSPASTQNQGCGNCGNQIRSCNNSCQWGSWGSCNGQGCTPGSVQNQGCGNCGDQTRSCNSSCQWNSWGSCN
ncbi:M23 family metallopeptidase, partial [bacterium]|nr:M23 family metallopeptidase [bacterium]